MLKFNIGYFLITMLLLAIEVIIALFLHDSIIRPFGGDFLVVILIYCFIKSFFDLPVLVAATGTLVFAYAVEISQYFHLVNLLGLEHSKLAKILLGTTFSFYDIMAYTFGIAAVLVVEKLKQSLARF